MQNKFDEAIEKLNQIVITFPNHSLEDDVLYAKAQISKSLKRYTHAINFYNEVIEKHPDEIRCDNAIFELANLYDTVLDDQEKAKELFQKLFIEYSDSTFAIEARKKENLTQILANSFCR